MSRLGLRPGRPHDDSIRWDKYFQKRSRQSRRPGSSDRDARSRAHLFLQALRRSACSTRSLPVPLNELE